MEQKNNNPMGQFLGKKMTRKEAIQKTGITALTAASLMFLTTNASAQKSGTATSAAKPGNNGTNGRGRNK